MSSELAQDAVPRDLLPKRRRSLLRARCPPPNPSNRFFPPILTGAIHVRPLAGLCAAALVAAAGALLAVWNGPPLAPLVVVREPRPPATGVAGAGEVGLPASVEAAWQRGPMADHAAAAVAELWEPGVEPPADRRLEVMEPGGWRAEMPAGRGVRYVASNPGQQLNVAFAEDGSVTFRSSRAGRDWRCTLARPDATPLGVTARGNRVDYQHAGGITEWYVNRPAGFEHGFTLAQPLPDGRAPEIRLAVEGLQAEPDPGAPGDLRLVDTGGRPVLTYRGLKAWDSTGRALPATMTALADGGVALAVEAENARYPVTIDPLVGSLDNALTGVDADAGDYFGRGVAVSGDTAVIGAPGHDPAAGEDGGAAYVYRRIAGEWTFEAKLTASDAAAHDQFGRAVAISGDTIVVGAWLADAGAHIDSGCAYVFTRDQATWSQQAVLVAGDAAANAHFGFSLTLEGDTLVAGAPSSDADGGAAYVLTRSAGVWSEQAKLVAADQTAGDQFGWDVALSGDTVLIGTYGDDTPAGLNAGSAYAFTRSGGLWSEQAKLTAADGRAGDYFGRSVALAGDLALIGAPQHLVTQGGYSVGAVYVFTRSGGLWSPEPLLSAPGFGSVSYFGGNVALSNELALIGAHLDYQPQAGGDVGSAYLFTRNGTGWEPPTKLVAADGSVADRFGEVLAVDGRTAIVGICGDDTPDGFDAGSAASYQLLAGVTNLLDDGPGSLRAAVAAAAPGDSIVFDQTLSGGTITLTSGPLAIGDDLVIDARDLPAGITLSGGGASRVLEIAAGAEVALAGLRLAGGSAGAGDGGAVSNQGGLTLDECDLSNNSATRGGAIHNAGTLVVNDSLFTGNIATDCGGAIHNVGGLTLTGACAFTGNSAATGGAVCTSGTLSATAAAFSNNHADAGSGGAIHNTGSVPLLAECQFSNNSAGDGGAISNGGTLTATAPAVSDNRAGRHGGAFANLAGGVLGVSAAALSNNSAGNTDPLGGGGVIHNAGTCTMTHVTLHHNTGPEGGAVLNAAGAILDLSNSTLAANESTVGRGGAISNYGTLSLVHSTVAANSSTSQFFNSSAGGIATTGDLHLENTIVAANTADNYADISGPLTTRAGANFIGDAIGVGWSQPPGPDILLGAPQLAPLGDYGGGMPTMPPLFGSPVIDSALPTPATPPLAQRGTPRPLEGDGDGIPEADIGSVEFVFLLVDTALDENDGDTASVIALLADPGGTGISLREALSAAANESAATQIGFAASLDGGLILLTGGELLVGSQVMLDASSLPAGLTISAGEASRVMRITDGPVTIRGLTLAGGRNYEDINGGGGGVLNEGQLSLTEVRLTDNRGSVGGGVLNYGQLTLERCRLDDNRAWSGGAIHNRGTLVINECEIGGNLGGHGGGIDALHDSHITIRSSTIANNLSDGEGGAVRATGTLLLSHSTVSNNEGGHCGGVFGRNGIYGPFSLTLENTVLAGNRSNYIPAGEIVLPAPPSTALSNGGNVIGDNSGVESLFPAGVPNPAGDRVGGGANPLAPKLAPLADYGTPVRAMPPLPGSPAIDAGLPMASTPATDQLGSPRPAGIQLDSGAVEVFLWADLPPVDTDADGIDDRVEPAYGLVVGVNNSDADGDGDGATDAEELLAMTDPANGADRLRITTFAPAATPGHHVVGFPTFPGIDYIIEADQLLDFGGANARALHSFTAVGYSASFEVPLEAERDFVRVRIE